MKTKGLINRQGGFTLIEILTVLVVIGLLATMAVLGARYIARAAATKAISKHVEDVYASCTALFSQRGAFTANVGFAQTPTALLGTNFSTTTPAVAGAYTDFRMILVANGLMGEEQVMFQPPTAWRGFQTTSPYPQYATTASGIQSLDGRSWSRLPDTALTSGVPANGMQLMTSGGQRIVTCTLRTRNLKPSESGQARTGYALEFNIAVDQSLATNLRTELNKILSPKGYLVGDSANYTPSNGDVVIEVVSPRLSY